jgi:hypothetical protein
MSASRQPVVLVGNRMLGIMALAAAAVALLPAAERFGGARLVVAALAAAVGVGLLVRRVELHPGEVRWRTLARRRSCARAELTGVSRDHRFLRFRPPSRPSVRIEVPAELRPEVRTWVDGSSSSSGSNDPS